MNDDLGLTDARLRQLELRILDAVADDDIDLVWSLRFDLENERNMARIRDRHIKKWSQHNANDGKPA